MAVVQALASPRGSLLIVEDDERFARDVVAVPFTDEWDIVFAYNVPQARSAIAECDGLNVALVDLNLPGGLPFSEAGRGGGFDVVELVLQRYPACHVVVLTGYLDARLVNAVARLGAHYMVKEQVHDALVELAVAGRSMLANAAATVREHVSGLAKRDGLTPREAEVLSLLLAGLNRDRAAETLGVASNTVKHHVRSILRKSSARSIHDLRYAYRCAACCGDRGLVQLKRS